MLKWKHTQTNIKCLGRMILNSKHFGWFETDEKQIIIVTSVSIMVFEHDDDLLEYLNIVKTPDIDAAHYVRLNAMDDWISTLRCLKYSDREDAEDGLFYFRDREDQKRYYFDNRLFLPILKAKKSNYVIDIREYNHSHGAFIVDITRPVGELCCVILGVRR